MTVGMLSRFLAVLLVGAAAPAFSEENVPVNALNFVRAETDSYMALFAAQGYFANFVHTRAPTPIAEQNVIRQNRDTLYSGAVFDLTSPVTIKMPDNEGRFQSMLIINQDHYVVDVQHEGGAYTFTEDEAGSKYIVVVIRTFMDPSDPEDIAEANRLMDDITFEQADIGSFEVPDWDRVSLDRTRGLLNSLLADIDDFTGAFGARGEVDPILHFIATGGGWGGNPPHAAVYLNQVAAQNNGVTPHTLTVKDVPVDGFWSVTVYNEDGYLEANDLDAYSVNNVTAEREDDGVVTVHFGGCADGRVNCLPITDGWNYVVRLYQPRNEILSGKWTFPLAVSVE